MVVGSHAHGLLLLLLLLPLHLRPARRGGSPCVGEKKANTYTLDNTLNTEITPQNTTESRL
jgi:hypothetical protein